MSGRVNGDGLEKSVLRFSKMLQFLLFSHTKHLQQSYCVQEEQSFALVSQELKGVSPLAIDSIVQSFRPIRAYRQPTPISLNYNDGELLIVRDWSSNQLNKPATIARMTRH